MWYDICGVYEGQPYQCNPIDHLDVALDTARMMAEDWGYTEVVICIRGRK